MKKSFRSQPEFMSTNQNFVGEILLRWYQCQKHNLGLNIRTSAYFV